MGKAALSKAARGWSNARIKYELAEKGYTFARIAREHGYVDNAPNSVMWRPWSVMERIVAHIVGVNPWVIWPDRYDGRRRHLGTKTILAARRAESNA